MTGRERLICALNHQEPDTVPIFECVYSRAVFLDQLGYIPETFDPVSVLECSHRVGYDFSFIPIPGVSGFRPEGEREETYTDEWGIKRRVVPNTWPIDAGVDTPMTDAEDWANYRMPDPEAAFRYTGLAECLKLAKEYGMGVVGNVRGPYSAAWQLFDLENFSCMLFTDPDVVHEVLTACTDFALACARRMVAMGVDAVLYSDDYGSNTAPLMSPKHFDTFLLPQLKRIREESAKMGTKMILHSDGCIAPLLTSIMSAGVHGLHPIQRCPGMDLAAVKREYGAQATLFGNVDNAGTLVTGSKEEIETMVKACIRAAAPGGGYCLSSDHSVHDDIPNENVYAMYEAGRRFGKYPIQL